jgi:hypothetical protein
MILKEIKKGTNREDMKNKISLLQTNYRTVLKIVNVQVSGLMIHDNQNVKTFKELSSFQQSRKFKAKAKIMAKKVFARKVISSLQRSTVILKL